MRTSHPIYKVSISGDQRVLFPEGTDTGPETMSLTMCGNSLIRYCKILRKRLLKFTTAIYCIIQVNFQTAYEKNVFPGTATQHGHLP